MEKIKYKIQQRDWVYILILSMVVQFIIYFLAFVYNSSTNALGYVSFAGTMVSIILAVIAIGYTYGESIRQKHNEDELIIQIRGLSEIKEKLGDQVDVLEQIADLKKDVNNTKELTISNIQNLMKNMTPESPAFSSNTANNNFPFLSQMNLVLFAQISTLIYIYDNCNSNNYRDFSKGVKKYYIDKFTTNNEVMLSFEGAMAIWTILNNLGVWDETSYKPELKELLKGKIDKNSEILKNLPSEILDNLKSD